MNWPLPEEVSTEVSITQTYLKMAITFLFPRLSHKKKKFIQEKKQFLGLWPSLLSQK